MCAGHQPCQNLAKAIFSITNKEDDLQVESGGTAIDYNP